MNRSTDPLTLSVVVAAAFLALGPAGRAATIVLNPERDVTLYEDNTGRTANGSGQHLFAGVTGTPAITRAMLWFDVADAVPEGSIITAATLTLNMSRTSSGPRTVTVHVVGASWGEGLSDAGGGEGGGDLALANDATWLYRFHDSTAWSAAGGDFTLAPSASQDVGGTGQYTWGGAGLVADVQSWLDFPAANHGWMLRGNEAEERSAQRFDSRQNTIPANWPRLSLDYTPVPELERAGCLTAGVLGTWVLLCHRRRAASSRRRRGAGARSSACGLEPAR